VKSWKDKSPGDDLYASEVNQIAKAAFKRLPDGSFIQGQNTESITGFFERRPHFQYTVELLEQYTPEGESEAIPGVWIIYIVSYYENEDESTWESSGWNSIEREWYLDARCIVNDPDNDQGEAFVKDIPYLEAGQLLCAYWDKQRGMFVPAGLPLYTVRRFTLLESISECGEATAQMMIRNGLTYETIEDRDPDRIVDTLGAIEHSPLATTDEDTDVSTIAAGKCLDARYAYDPDEGAFWEALRFSECDCVSTSVSSESSESSSPRESSPSERSPSQSGSDSGGSEKSSAIVPASWSPGGYTALYVVESPEVLFVDVVGLKTTQNRMTWFMDERFIEVCEPDSIQIDGFSTSEPVMVGFKIDEGRVRLRIRGKEYPDEEIVIVFRLTGIRKGFKDTRFPDMTREDFLANERFLRMAMSKCRKMEQRK